MDAVAPDLWVQRGDRIRLLGVPFDTACVIVRLPDGALWLHSPVQPTAARVAEVASLGPVGHVVAPNRIHGAFTADWARIAPRAKVWVSPRFPERHPDVRFDALLTDRPPPDWSETLDQCVFGGSLYLDGVEFLHRPSRTLILTDLLQHHDPAREPAVWRLLKGLAGMLAPRTATPPDLRATFRDRDRDAVRAARDLILLWDFDRILLPHAVPVPSGGKAVFRDAMVWLG